MQSEAMGSPRRLALWWSWLGCVRATRPAGPCDIFAAGGTPCVAAHSVARALYANFSGPLYEIRRASDNATTDVPVEAIPIGWSETRHSRWLCMHCSR